MLRTAVLAVATVLLAACGASTTPTATPAPSATPSPPATAAPTATPTNAPTPAPTPTATATPGSSGSPTAEVCGTDWFSSPAICDGDVGDRFVFQCPPGGQATAIYGTDAYTDDSGACTAAVHAGLIGFVAGGSVTLELTRGLGSYTGSLRNGVESSNWGSWPTSFVFVGGPIAVATPTPGSEGPPPADPAILAHIPAAMNVNCGKVTTLSAGEVTAALCTPPQIDGYVTYVLFDTSTNLQDKWFGDNDYFGDDDPGTDCNAGPCLVGWTGSTGLVEGRYFHNHYAGVDPNGYIAYWFDESLLIEGGIALNSGTFADLYSLALQAGPIP